MRAPPIGHAARSGQDADRGVRPVPRGFEPDQLEQWLPFPFKGVPLPLTSSRHDGSPRGRDAGERDDRSHARTDPSMRPLRHGVISDFEVTEKSGTTSSAKQLASDEGARASSSASRAGSPE